MEIDGTFSEIQAMARGKPHTFNSEKVGWYILRTQDFLSCSMVMTRKFIVMTWCTVQLLSSGKRRKWLYSFGNSFVIYSLVIESDPCCFQVSIACEPDKPEDEDCKGSVVSYYIHIKMIIV